LLWNQEREGKKKKSDKRETIIDHMTELKMRQNLRKCCSVSVSLQIWMNQWNCSEANVRVRVLEKKSSNHSLYNVERVWFFLKNCCLYRSNGIEAVQSHRCSCGSGNKQVCNAFALQNHHHYCDRTEDRIRTWTITSCSSDTRLLKWGTLEFKTKRSCSQFRGLRRNGKNYTETTGKAIQLIHDIRFSSEHLKGKPVSILRGVAKNVVLSCRLFIAC